MAVVDQRGSGSRDHRASSQSSGPQAPGPRPQVPSFGSPGWEDAVRAAAEWGQKNKAWEAYQRGEQSKVPNYQEQYDRYSQLDRQFSNRQENSPFRQQQMGISDMLRKEAMGQGIGQRLVRDQAQQAADRASAQQFAALGGARPGMQAMSARNAMLGTALAQSNVGEQAAMAGGQMALGAQGLYAQHAQGARGQDQNWQGMNDAGMFNALAGRQSLSGMQQQGAQFGLSLEEQRRQFNASQPSTFDKAAGAVMGGVSLYAMGGGFGGGGAAAARMQPQSVNFSGGSGPYVPQPLGSSYRRPGT